jgi:DNA-binding GntR family transcriptional regulator
MTRPLVSTNLSALAFERLEEAILTGVLKPGERISEAILARRFGISRGPLREALSRLEGRKLVQRVTNQGARVVSLTQAEVIDLLVIREGLEGIACRLAAERISDAELEQLEALLDQHAQAEDIVSGRAYFQGEGEGDFHFRIVKASANARLAQMLSHDLYSLLRLYRYRLSTKAERPLQALNEHRAVLAALKRRDPDAAEAAMRTHIRNSRASLEFVMAGIESERPTG